MGRRDVPFADTLYIDRSDFMLDPPAKYFRLAPGRSVRLLNAYIITCHEVVHNDEGEVIELKCEYHRETLGGKKCADGRKVKGFIQWVSAQHAIDATVRCYTSLFLSEKPNVKSMEELHAELNKDSLQTFTAKVEPMPSDAAPESVFQFNRVGYFCADRIDHTPDTQQYVFNQTVSLRQGF